MSYCLLYLETISLALTPFILSPTVNGSTELKRVEVATVVGSEEGHTFQYYPGESNDTVWPGEGMF